ncbi:MAG: ankyrin repeat domain-containing protein [Chitinophagaceae bacterium]
MSTRCIVLPVVIMFSCLANLAAQPVAAVDSIRNLQLFQTIRSGDVTKLQALLKQGASSNAKLNGYSAVMAAALNGTVEEMKILLDNGADPNYFNQDSISAIWLAVPDYAKTSLLINAGANVQQVSREKSSVLLKLAAIPGSAALMQLLIDKGCDPLHSGPANDLMYNAALSGDTAIVGLLLRKGVSAKDSSSLGDYPVNAATNYRCFNTLQLLVENGADVNASPKHGILPLFAGVTPLMWAAVSNDKSSFYYLLKHGADAKAKSPRGYTTLMFLAMSEEDDPEMTMALIERGASPAAKAFDETDALHHAQLKGNTKSVAILKKYISK